MPEIKTEYLFTLALEVQGFTIGDTPYGSRRIFRFDSGNFEGPKLKGAVLPGGGGWRSTECRGWSRPFHEMKKDARHGSR